MTDSGNQAPLTDFRTRSQRKIWEQSVNSQQERLANSSGDGATSVVPTEQVQLNK